MFNDETIDTIIEQQGWNMETVLELVSQYLTTTGQLEHFETFIRNIANEENAG